MREVVASIHPAVSRGEFHLIKFMHRGTTGRDFSRGALAPEGQKAYQLAQDQRPDSSTARAAVIDIYSRGEIDVRPDLLGAALLSERARVQEVITSAHIKVKPGLSAAATYMNAVNDISADFRLAQLMEVLPHAELVRISRTEENGMLLTETLKLINEQRRRRGLRDTQLK